MFSFALLIPFLNLLFGINDLVTDKPELAFNTNSLLEYLNYYISDIIITGGKEKALIYICMILVVAFFSRNLSRFFAMYFMANVRIGAIKGIRNKIYTKILTLPLSFFSRHKKGDIIAKKAGLTTLQWIVLLNIARDPNLPIVQNGEATHSGVLASEIAANRGVSRANISPIISTLIKNKLITQKDHPKDRRRKTLHVSEKGMSALKSIQDERRFLNDRLFDMISNDDQTVLTHSLKRLLNTVSGFPHVEIHENVS